MIDHPYFALSRRGLATGTIVAFSGWAALTVILVWAVPADHRAAIGALVAAPTPAAAEAQLALWEPGVARSFSFLLGFDFLYDIVHNNAAALLVVWGAVLQSSRSARWIGSAAAWLLWLDTLLNVFENLAFLHVLRSGSAEPLLPIASLVFSFRSLTLLLALLIGAGLHVVAWRTRRRTGRSH